jgi:threonine dehydrogenase-like Zn-dependent dehydrogenase
MTGQAKGVRAAVLTAAQQLGIQTFPVASLGEDDALIRVEVCGLGGSDVTQYLGKLRPSSTVYPVILGHVFVGTVESVGPRAARRWRVAPGDRVVTEAIVPCWACRNCVSGHYSLCDAGEDLLRYGLISADREPSLWGGFAELVYVPRGALLHRVSPAAPLDALALVNSIASGIRWGGDLPGFRAGEVGLVLGPGQRGLATALAMMRAGADKVIVTGRSSDAHKLAVAKRWGVDVVVDVDSEDVVDVVRHVTGGAMADVVVDASAVATQPVTDAIKAVRKDGRVVLIGLKRGAPIPGLVTDELIYKGVTVIGAMAADYSSFERACRLIERDGDLIAQANTHAFGLDQVEQAIRTLAGDVTGADAIGVSVEPRRTTHDS